eukprot:TRINITY_DN43492_c0_g1_i1.p1 TRINITY_DN43492_c0_g1~~TRINITY_DN43492_c0_g1_i1.p1  ORF type:complete len:419 (-),score=84.79 TRINITY_DN43492_c0_g1_i1:102-1358(-)
MSCHSQSSYGVESNKKCMSSLSFPSDGDFRTFVCEGEQRSSQEGKRNVGPQSRTCVSDKHENYGALGAFLGTWRCQTGSIHNVVADGGGATSCTVRTIREGRRDRVTRLRLKYNDEHGGDSNGHVQWGQNYELEKFKTPLDTVKWAPRDKNCNKKECVWKRVHSVDSQQDTEKHTLVRRPRVVWDNGNIRSRRLLVFRRSDSWDSAEEAYRQEELDGYRRMSSPRASTGDLALDTNDQCKSSQGNSNDSDCTDSTSRISPEGSTLGDNSEVLSCREKHDAEEETIVASDAAMFMDEALTAQMELAAALEERAALAKEVAALKKKRIAEEMLVEDYWHEEEVARKRLARCHDDVATSVGSMDVMIGDDETRAEMLMALEQAKAEAEEAAARIAALDAEEANRDAGYCQQRDGLLSDLRD